jgi:hypothetical protein
MCEKLFRHAYSVVRAYFPVRTVFLMPSSYSPVSFALFQSLYLHLAFSVIPATLLCHSVTAHLAVKLSLGGGNYGGMGGGEYRV